MLPIHVEVQHLDLEVVPAVGFESSQPSAMQLFNQLLLSNYDTVQWLSTIHPFAAVSTACSEPILVIIDEREELQPLTSFQYHTERRANIHAHTYRLLRIGLTLSFLDRGRKNPQTHSEKMCKLHVEGPWVPAPSLNTATA